MDEQRTKISGQFAPGDMLTKMDVCRLFCERLRISKSTYYKQVYPRLKFHPVENELLRYGTNGTGAERMPYTIAIGILNKMTGNRQNSDPHDYVLNKYLK
ncbi:MAG: hypothetical protein JJU13_06080 [Balneolaceae bacterium]|nr:hypothetical protein [Balneolaceae bacterium]